MAAVYRCAAVIKNKKLGVLFTPEKKWDCSRLIVSKGLMKGLYRGSIFDWETRIFHAAGTVPFFSVFLHGPAKYLGPTPAHRD
jgi:hypothetical protein